MVIKAKSVIWGGRNVRGRCRHWKAEKEMTMKKYWWRKDWDLQQSSVITFATNDHSEKWLLVQRKSTVLSLQIFGDIQKDCRLRQN